MYTGAAASLSRKNASRHQVDKENLYSHIQMVEYPTGAKLSNLNQKLRQSANRKKQAMKSASMWNNIELFSSSDHKRYNRSIYNDLPHGCCELTITNPNTN